MHSTDVTNLHKNAYANWDQAVSKLDDKQLTEVYWALLSS
jgi:hypothetical protein